jgi:hypothetical protein
MAAGSEMQDFLEKTIHIPSPKEMLANTKNGWENLRIGDGHFTAWFRQGFKELTHMLLPAFPQGQHIVEEPGLWGNPTQGEVARGREDQPSARQLVSALNEEPLQKRTSVRSPADLVEGNSGGPAQGQQKNPGQSHGPSL